ncbi:hypothetical protein DFH09DRAFT_1113651 [Mycena vulgaris]|nr:hypothetical protein DFH09DRAFT_1113651 [Mycena vulgaris]
MPSQPVGPSTRKRWHDGGRLAIVGPQKRDSISDSAYMQTCQLPLCRPVLGPFYAMLPPRLRPTPDIDVAPLRVLPATWHDPTLQGDSRTTRRSTYDLCVRMVKTGCVALVSEASASYKRTEFRACGSRRTLPLPLPAYRLVLAPCYAVSFLDGAAPRLRIVPCTTTTWHDPQLIASPRRIPIRGSRMTIRKQLDVRAGASCASIYNLRLRIVKAGLRKGARRIEVEDGSLPAPPHISSGCVGSGFRPCTRPRRGSSRRAGARGLASTSTSAYDLTSSAAEVDHQDEAVARTVARETWRVDVEDDSLGTTVQGFGGWMSRRLRASHRVALLLLAKLPPTPASSRRESSGQACAGTAAQGTWRVHVDIQDESPRTLLHISSGCVSSHGVDGMTSVSEDKAGSVGDSAGGCRGLRASRRAASARSEIHLPTPPSLALVDRGDGRALRRQRRGLVVRCRDDSLRTLLCISSDCVLWLVRLPPASTSHKPKAAALRVAFVYHRDEPETWTAAEGFGGPELRRSAMRKSVDVGVRRRRMERPVAGEQQLEKSIMARKMNAREGQDERTFAQTVEDEGFNSFERGPRPYPDEGTSEKNRF